MEFNLKNQNNEDGIVIAPAGCGKTETIINIIKDYNGDKKILVLTHTNAGVENIKKRLKTNNVLNKKYYIFTIASFCTRYAKSFKTLSKIKDESYIQYYYGMNTLLDNKNIRNIIKMTYSLMLVDEYQDCNFIQHEVIKKISKILHYKIFGDPLQAIYNFDGPCIDFNKIIDNDYKMLGYMNYPWRWKYNNLDMGNWIMESRIKLENNNNDIYENIPKGVEIFYYKNYKDLIKKSYDLLKIKGKKVILCDYEEKANSLCKKLGGQFFFQEEIECKRLKKFTQLIKSKNEIEILKELINIIKDSYTNFATYYETIIKKILKNDFDFKKIKKDKEFADIFVEIKENFKIIKLLNIINYIEKDNRLRLYRKELWNVLKILICEVSKNQLKQPNEILTEIRNSQILNEKFKYTKLVSRILLVKGLEFENVLLVDPEKLSKELLYVGISRPTKKLILAIKKQ